MPVYPVTLDQIKAALATNKQAASSSKTSPTKKGKGKAKQAEAPVEVAQPPKETTEDARERRNRLARERRARKKQDVVDTKAGVTLATGKIQLPKVDPNDSVFVPPPKLKKQRVKKLPSPQPVQEPDPVDNQPKEEEEDHLSEDEEEQQSDTSSNEMLTEEEAYEALMEDEQEEPVPVQQTPKRKRITPTPVPDAPKKKKPTNLSAGSENDEPPKWYTKLLTEIVKVKVDEAGEKVSKKVMEATGHDVATERWADPAQRDKIRASQDRLYNEIFGSRGREYRRYV